MSESSFLSKLSSPHVLVLLLIVLALSSVFFGWKGWKNTFKFSLISNGIDYNGDLVNQKQNNLLNNKADKGLDFNDPSLRVKDTDNDGLNDWEELNVHKTSPYIPDTDSDNINDGDEIRLNKDPLCAEGTNCLVEESVSTSTMSTSLNDNQLLEQNTLPNVENEIDSIKNISSQELRQVLLDNGYAPDQLNQLTDEQLSEIWREAVDQIKKQ